MIYLNNIPDSQVIFIPRHGRRISGSLKLKARNTTGNYSMEMQTSDTGVSEIYFYLEVTLPEDTISGEYEYDLLKGTEVLSSGVLEVRDVASVIEYENTIIYEQFIS